MSIVSHTVDGRLIAPPQFAVTVARGFWLLTMIFDAALIVAVSAAACIGYHYAAYGTWGPVGLQASVGAFVAAIYVGLRTYDRRYRSERIRLEKDRYRSIAVAWNVAFLCLLAVGFLIKETDVYSRGATIVFYLAGAAGLMVGRSVVRAVLRLGFDRGWFIARRVFLYGTRPRVEQFLQRYDPAGNGLLVVGTWYLPEDVEDAADPSPERIRENLDEAINHARMLDIDDVFIVAPWSSREIIAESTDAFLAIPASIHLTPERHFESFSDLRIKRVGPAACLRLARPPLTGGEILVKRAMDIALASAALLILWPVMVAVAAAIYAETGRPIIFRQRRHGFNATEFRILKFRTMTCHDDSLPFRQARPGDERITRVGRYLRRWNLDELPQLFNVLKGDMSIVGPRPHALAHNKAFERRIAHYARRHNVKPGITGWAQVNGLRGVTDTNEKMQARVAHDLYYIENWSVAFDLYIILLTLFSPRVHWNAV